MSYISEYKRAATTPSQCLEYTPDQIAAINGERLCGSGADHVTFLKQCSKMANGLRPVPVTRQQLNSRRNPLRLALHILYKCVHTNSTLTALDVYKYAIGAEDQQIITASEADLLIIKAVAVAERHNSNQEAI